MTHSRRWWLVLAAVCAGMAPGTWLRTHVSAPAAIDAVEVDPIAGESGDGELRLAGAWDLSAPSRDFGGFSALLVRQEGFLAFSDRGFALRMGYPRDAVNGWLPATLARVGRREMRKASVDIEAATQASADGPVWLAYEYSNSIARLGADLTVERSVAPGPMRGWDNNSGPESLTRLPDGRFLVLEEGRYISGPRASHGLLFAGDPVTGVEPVEFTFMPPDGFRPSDMAALPDGRVLVLLRGIDRIVPPRFSTRIVIADPAMIRAGEEWNWQALPDLRGDAPRENYEGIAAEPRGDGALTLWLVSDDNTAALQRTILMELVWRPDGVADHAVTP